MHGSRHSEQRLIHPSQPKVATHCKIDIYNFAKSFETLLKTGIIIRLERQFGSQRVVDWLAVG